MYLMHPYDLLIDTNAHKRDYDLTILNQHYWLQGLEVYIVEHGMKEGHPYYYRCRVCLLYKVDCGNNRLQTFSHWLVNQIVTNYTWQHSYLPPKYLKPQNEHFHNRRNSISRYSMLFHPIERWWAW